MLGFDSLTETALTESPIPDTIKLSVSGADFALTYGTIKEEKLIVQGCGFSITDGILADTLIVAGCSISITGNSVRIWQNSIGVTDKWTPTSFPSGSWTPNPVNSATWTKQSQDNSEVWDRTY